MTSTKETGKADAPKNSLGIPAAVFVEDVDSFMKGDENQENAELVLRQLDEQHSKYKFMEMNLMRKKRILKKQIPDIKTSLDMLKLLKTKKEESANVDTQFMVCDDLYIKAKVPPTDKVGLWLGANVMLEYTLKDAEDLLSRNFQTATKNLSQLEEDLDFLRDQLTTTEVNMARVYNWDVKRRAAEKEKTAPVL
ncbi:prefoldin subunit 3 [Parasteatoda tepidariorum]|uniref:prefoldin subunit 3 n=1 Tax=Parasteatoda tepidariorum TaxID=114398 RepID=UPI00077FC07C|nr:prefoldin subunit 3 [Parasteatoda tepidariorum]